MGPWEIGLIVVAVLIVFGAGRLAGVGKALGQGIREFREEATKPSDEGEESDEQEMTDEAGTVASSSSSDGAESGRKPDGQGGT